MDILIAWKYLLASFVSFKKAHIAVSLVLSISFTFFIEKMGLFFETQHNNTSLWALGIVGLLVGLFISVDFVYGILADKVKKRRANKPFSIESGKVGTTIGKYLGVALYGMIAMVIFFKFSNTIVMIAMLGPLILTGLKEFISIGENIEGVTGSKPYIFTIVDRLFDAIEKRFFQEAEEFINKHEV